MIKSPSTAVVCAAILVLTPGLALTSAEADEVVAGATKQKKPKQKRPVVTQVSPASGATAGGTRVTIKGRHLDRLKKVTVGGRRATVVKKVGAQQIIVRTPEAVSCAKSANRVAVQTAGGTSKPAKRSRFTYKGRAVTPAVVAGEYFSAALRNDGRVYAWGDGLHGKLGQGDGVTHLTPVRVKQLRYCVSRISAGDDHTVALTAGGKVLTWGWSWAGQAGDDALGYRSTPVRARISAKVTQVSAAGAKTVALTRSGKVYAWGNEQNDEFNGGAASIYRTPLLLPTFTSVKKVIAGDSNIAVIKKDGTVWMTGTATALGDGSASSNARTARQVAGLDAVRDVRIGYLSVNAFDSSGTMWGWGLNNGQSAGGTATGNGQTFLTAPVKVSTGAVAQIAGTFSHGLLRRSDGTVWGWGYCTTCDPAGGAAGSGIRFTPTQVPGLNGTVGVGAGYRRFHAIAADGTVWAWGTGHLGNGAGATTDVTSPVKVSGLDLIR